MDELVASTLEANRDYVVIEIRDGNRKRIGKYEVTQGGKITPEPATEEVRNLVWAQAVAARKSLP